MKKEINIMNNSTLMWLFIGSSFTAFALMFILKSVAMFFILTTLFLLQFSYKR